MKKIKALFSYFFLFLPLGLVSLQASTQNLPLYKGKWVSTDKIDEKHIENMKHHAVSLTERTKQGENFMLFFFNDKLVCDTTKKKITWDDLKGNILSFSILDQPIHKAIGANWHKEHKKNFDPKKDKISQAYITNFLNKELGLDRLSKTLGMRVFIKKIVIHSDNEEKRVQAGKVSSFESMQSIQGDSVLHAYDPSQGEEPVKDKININLQNDEQQDEIYVLVEVQTRLYFIKNHESWKIRRRLFVVTTILLTACGIAYFVMRYFYRQKNEKETVDTSSQTESTENAKELQTATPNNITQITTPLTSPATKKDDATAKPRKRTRKRRNPEKN